MTETELQAWAESQIKALQAAGIDALDAGNTVKRVLEMLPPGQDPATWIPTPAMLDTPIDSEAAIQDARADFYASDAIPAKYKRILDAAETET